MRNEGVQNHSWASASVFRYRSIRTGPPYSGTELVPAPVYLFIPVPDWQDAGQFRNSIKLLGKLLSGPFQRIFWGGQKSNLAAFISSTLIVIKNCFSKLNRVNCNDMYTEKSAAIDFCVDRRHWPYFMADLFSFREIWKTTWKCRLKATMIIDHLQNSGSVYPPRLKTEISLWIPRTGKKKNKFGAYS